MNVTKTLTLSLETMNEIDRISGDLKKKFPDTVQTILDLGIREYRKKNGEIRTG